MRRLRPTCHDLSIGVASYDTFRCTTLMTIVSVSPTFHVAIPREIRGTHAQLQAARKS